MLTVDLDRLGLRPGDRLLDAGCGTGRHCFGAIDRRVQAIGLDLDADSLRIARSGIDERRAKGIACGVLQGDVLSLPFSDNYFDAVICSEVMEHVHDYFNALRELTRVLRPGGTLAVTIPTATSEHMYWHLSRDYFESPGGHIRIFSPQNLAQAMADAGVRVESSGFAHALHTPYWALRSALGLHDENLRPVHAYRAFLMRASLSPFWIRTERALNWICPKSLVLYGRRVAAGIVR